MIYLSGEIPRMLDRPTKPQGRDVDSWLDAWEAVKQLELIPKSVIVLKAWGFSWAEIEHGLKLVEGEARAVYYKGVGQVMAICNDQ